jgi:hypothetical protein
MPFLRKDRDTAQMNHTKIVRRTAKMQHQITNSKGAKKSPFLAKESVACDAIHDVVFVVTPQKYCL